MNGNGIETEHEEGVQTEIGTLALIQDVGALGEVERAAIDTQIATAKRYPRSVAHSLKEAEGMVTLDEETAGSMFYTLKRSGKKIMGPSVRLAEVAAYSWGNLRVDAGVESTGKTHLTAVGTCFDLEKNVAIRVRVERRITDSKNRRYNDDMIGTTGNAATSIALRNAICRVIPRVYIDQLDQKARSASLGKTGTLTEKRQNAVTWFQRAGVTEPELFAFLEVQGIEDISLQHLVELKGVQTALKDGAATIEELFRPSDKSEGVNEMNDALKAKQAAATATAGRAPAPEPVDDSPATKEQLEQLKSLLPKAREAGAIDSQDEELIASAQKQKDGPAVRQWIRDLQAKLLRGQTSLGVEG